MQLVQTTPVIGSNLITAEGQGGGIILMMNEMQNRDLRAPEFRATQDSFTVVLWRSSVNLSNKADEIISAIKNTEPTHKNDTTNMLSNTMKNKVDILTFIPKNKDITARELADITGKSVETIRRNLRKLIQENKVEAIGKNEKQKSYVPTNQLIPIERCRQIPPNKESQKRKNKRKGGIFCSRL